MASAAKKAMSDDHKQALAQGRSEGRSVRAYLEALESSRPKRGRKRTKKSISDRLATIIDEIEHAEPLRRLQLAQEELDLTQELASMENTIDLAQLQGDFVAVAKSYAERKGISYTAFRQVGVPASVLKQAGISRNSG